MAAGLRRTLTAALVVAALATTLVGCEGNGALRTAATTSSSDPSTSEGPTTLATDAPASIAAPASSRAPASTGAPASTDAPSTTSAPPPSSSPAPAVLLAAGDIASCSSGGDEATAALLDARPEATVATLGDNAYDSGTASEFANCYQPSWGASKQRTKPAAGNHDYGRGSAAGYFGYFGPGAGSADAGYYSYNLGPWHLVVLNSNCSAVSCAAGGAQERWLRADLAAHQQRCTMAYWHHPRFSSGTTHGSSTTVAPLWQTLYDGGADLVLQGHEHNYERFGPLDPAGRTDPSRGMRSFVVGTGGVGHYELAGSLPGSEVRNDDTFGVLQLTLRATGFNWEFLPQAEKTFRDSGTAACH